MTFKDNIKLIIAIDAMALLVWFIFWIFIIISGGIMPIQVLLIYISVVTFCGILACIIMPVLEWWMDF